MARYIKANPRVTSYLQLDKDRNMVKDGNYLLWQSDMLAFGPLVDLPIILEKIGAIALKSHEAREEQDGTRCRPLQVATDPRFVIEPAPQPKIEAETQHQDAVEDSAPAEQEIKKNPKEKETKK